MEMRTLGRTGLRVSRIGLGCVTFGREIDDATSSAILDRALAHGITLLDTAEAYGPPLPDGSRSHASEQTLGRWLADRRCRDRVVIETKITPPLTRERIASGIDAALRRLRTDVIDLFLFHAPDPKTPIAESLSAAADAIAAGKIRHVGCSNFTAPQLAAALDADPALPRLAVVQTNYNLAMRAAATELFPLCSSRGVGLQTYSPLGAGFLMGKYSADRGAMPAGTRFAIAPAHADLYFHADKFEQARRLERLAAETGRSRAELAIAWVLKHRAIDNVLAGARDPSQVDAAVRAMQLKYDPEWDAILELEGVTP